MKQLPDDFRDFLKLLISNKAKFLLVGGYAVNCHGYPRSTGDIDIWIEPSQQNARKLLKCIEEFGFTNTGLKVQTLTELNKVFRMGYPPLRIEVLTGISGLEFNTAYKNKVFFKVEDLEIPTISLEDLKTNKKASGRSKDKDDLENLK